MAWIPLINYEPRGSLASEAALNPLICHQLSRRLESVTTEKAVFAQVPQPMSAFARGLNIFFSPFLFFFFPLLALPLSGSLLGPSLGFEQQGRPRTKQESAPKIGLDMNHELQSSSTGKYSDSRTVSAFAFLRESLIAGIIG